MSPFPITFRVNQQVGSRADVVAELKAGRALIDSYIAASRAGRFSPTILPAHMLERFILLVKSYNDDEFLAMLVTSGVPPACDVVVAFLQVVRAAVEHDPASVLDPRLGALKVIAQAVCLYSMVESVWSLLIDVFIIAEKSVKPPALRAALLAGLKQEGLATALFTWYTQFKTEWPHIARLGQFLRKDVRFVHHLRARCVLRLGFLDTSAAQALVAHSRFHEGVKAAE